MKYKKEIDVVLEKIKKKGREWQEKLELHGVRKVENFNYCD